MAAKKPSVHLSAESHKIIKRASKRSGMKIMPLVDNIIQAWFAGEIFFLPERLNGAIQKGEKKA